MGNGCGNTCFLVELGVVEVLHDLGDGLDRSVPGRFLVSIWGIARLMTSRLRVRDGVGDGTF